MNRSLVRRVMAGAENSTLARAAQTAESELAVRCPPPYDHRMLEGARLAVVVPAYNEERLLTKTLTTMPSFVDDVVVVDDASTDATFAIASAFSDGRIRV